MSRHYIDSQHYVEISVRKSIKTKQVCWDESLSVPTISTDTVFILKDETNALGKGTLQDFLPLISDGDHLMMNKTYWVCIESGGLTELKPLDEIMY